MDRPDKRGANVVSTHTAAYPRQPVGFNTQPPEGGCSYNAIPTLSNLWFQHTAARRRLHQSSIKRSQFKRFQHTAARRRLPACRCSIDSAICFNTQPPEGGCPIKYDSPISGMMFQHTAARRRLLYYLYIPMDATMFQHTAARRRLHKQVYCLVKDC